MYVIMKTGTGVGVAMGKCACFTFGPSKIRTSNAKRGYMGPKELQRSNLHVIRATRLDFRRGSPALTSSMTYDVLAKPHVTKWPLAEQDPFSYPRLDHLRASRAPPTPPNTLPAQEP